MTIVDSSSSLWYVGHQIIDDALPKDDSTEPHVRIAHGFFMDSYRGSQSPVRLLYFTCFTY
jgi:hypothetical protein